LQNRQIVLSIVVLVKLSDYFCRISAKELSGISFVTTDPAPPLSNRYTGQITELPIQQSSPIVMGKALSSVFLFLSSGEPCTIPEQKKH
jgi:hypothetical protein